MAVISESNDHSTIAASSCIVTIVDELKKLIGELCKVIFWSDGCSSQFRSKFVFAYSFHTLLTHFDRNIALQWNYNEAHHSKKPMDGVAGTIKRAVYGLVKSRHININTAEEIAAEASKGVPSIKSLYLSQEDEIIKPSFAKNAPAIKGTLDVHTIKRNYNLENVCFLAFYYLPDDKEPFHSQYYPRLNTLVCDHERESDEINENICSHYQKVYDGHSETWLQCPVCSLWFQESCFET